MSVPIQKFPDDGGPAFPAIASSGYSDPGMTLRDCFAKEAMGSICYRWAPDEHFEDKDATWAQIVAQRAYKFADAMIAERNKGRNV